MSRKLFSFIFLVSILVAGCQATPTIVPPNTDMPLATENIPFPLETATSAAPTKEPTSVSSGIDPANVSLQNGVLGDAQIALVPEQPYNNTNGPRVYGLPAHIEITFGETPEPSYFGQYPILTIIPIEEYNQMWADNGDPIIGTIFAAIQDLIANPPAQAPTSQLPVLPLDAVQAVIDLVAQFKPLETDLFQGYRFVGRLSQGINPVINSNLYYFFMGVSRDGQYIITMMVPVKSSILVDRIEDLPIADNDLLNSDYLLYMQSIRERLNQQSVSDFQPDLDALDAVVMSLKW